MIAEVVWPIRSGVLSAWCGYSLFSALSRVEAVVHGETLCQLLPPFFGVIGLRVPLKRAEQLLGIAPPYLDLPNGRIWLERPAVRTLRPRESLTCPLVTIKGKTNDSVLRDAVIRQAESRDIKATWIVSQRRIVKVAGAVIVGYGVHAKRLSEEDSIRLQSLGIGGRQRFGCGVFV